MKIWIIAFTLLGWVAQDLGAALVQIDNGRLSASFNDATQAFSLIEMAGGKTFLVDGKLAGETAKAEAMPAKDAVFDNGRRILVTQNDGSTFSLELYDSLPFLLVRTELHNGRKAMADFQKVVPATFTLDLGTPPAALRTMGTAGLTVPDQQPG